MEPLDSLAERIESERERASPPPEVRQQVRETLSGVSTQWEKLTQPFGEHQVLSEHLRRERKRFRNGERDEPLCECRDPLCPLKQGKLPAPVRRREDLVAAMFEYQDEHPEAVILLEAREALAEEKAEVRDAFREALDLLEVLDEKTQSVADLQSDESSVDVPATAATTDAEPEEADAD